MRVGERTRHEHVHPTPIPESRPSVLGCFPRRRARAVLLRGEELVELAARDLRTYVGNKAHQGPARVAPSRLHQRQKIHGVAWCGQPSPTGLLYNGEADRPPRPCFRHSFRTKLAHKRLDPVACDQPLLLRDDVGEDLLAALAHLV
eukprot:scaffold116323_cov57-Phaeocystis_antarctica.AAC.1